MRKIILYALVLSAAVSCKIEDGGYSRLHRNNLVSYGNNVISNYVMSGLYCMETMRQVDQYIKMSPEQQKDSPLYGKLVHEDDNTLVFLWDGSDVRTVIKTGGKSIMDEGVQWSVENFSIGPYLFYSSQAQFNAVLTCLSTDIWSVISDFPLSGVESILSIFRQDDTHGTFTFLGEENPPEDDRYKAVFTTNIGACAYTYHKGDEYTSDYWVFDGTFDIYIYEEGEYTDWCKAEYESEGQDGWKVTWTTSRD